MPVKHAFGRLCRTWMGVGLVYPSSVHAFTSGRDKFNEAKLLAWNFVSLGAWSKKGFLGLSPSACDAHARLTCCRSLILVTPAYGSVMHAAWVGTVISRIPT